MTFVPKNAVVAPCDFSTESFDAIRQAIELVRSPADVHVLYVLYEDVPVAAPGVVWGEVNPATRKAKGRESLEASLREHHCEGVTAEVRLGDPGTEIVDLAEEIGAELIVMPSHGRSGITRLLLGSVAERVLRMAHCPVLVLRPQVAA